MLDKVKGWVFGVLLNKYALGGVVKVWNFADGYRTQASLVTSGLVLAAGALGWIPRDESYKIATTLGGTAIATFLEKLKKHDALIEKVQDSVREARKPIDGPAQPL